MKEEGSSISVRKHIYNSAEFIGEALYELEDIIDKKYLEIVQEVEGIFSIKSSTLYKPCRYRKEEIWRDDALRQKALDEMLSGEWSIGDSYILDLPAQGYVLLRFYEISLGLIRVGEMYDLERILAVDRLTYEFMMNFGMMIGDGGNFVKKEIVRLRKRKSIIDSKIRTKWMTMICWIEKHHAQGDYNDVNSLDALANILEDQFREADNSVIHNHDHNTIVRCLKQVYRLKSEKPFSLPRILKRDIDYNI